MPKNRNLSPVPATLDAAEMLTAVTTSSEYARNLEDGHPTQRALARAALELAGMKPTTKIEEQYEPTSESLTTETYRHALLGTLPAFVHGIEAVDYYHKHPGEMKKGTYYALKRHTARFNHTVKAMIERDPHLDFDNISTTVSDLYGVLNRNRWGDDRKGYEQAAHDFTRQFEGVLRGMQQEVIAHQIILAINSDPSNPRVDVDSDVSIEDDMRGADLYVTLEGVTFPIDIKASERTAQNTRKKSRNPKAIITTGIPSPALNGAFIVSSHKARQLAPSMLAKLREARAEYMQTHAITEESLSTSATEVALAA